MANTTRGYLTVPTNDDVEMTYVNDNSLDLKRQSSLTASTGSCDAGRRVRNLNERKRERLNTELLDAVANGSSDLALRLLSEGASCRATCRRSGLSALHIATAYGEKKLVTDLLECGADPKAKDTKGLEAIHIAVWNDSIDIIDLLITKNGDLVNSLVDKEHFVEYQELFDSWNHCHEGFNNMVSVDLENGITPLHIASMRAYDDCVDFLIDHGAIVNAKSENDVTPIDVVGLHIADSQKPLVEEQSPKPFINKVNVHLNVGFKSAAFSPSWKSTVPLSPLLQIYQRLMNSDAVMPKGRRLRSIEARPRVQTKRTTTPLHTAVLKNDCDAIRYLLNNGACLMVWNSEEETALHLAVVKRLINPLKEMLSWNAEQCVKHGAHWESKVDVWNGQGMTPLLLAAKHQWNDGVALMLEEGADITVCSNKNENVLHLAARHGNSQMMREFLSAPNFHKIIEQRDEEKYTPVCRAVESNSLECLKALVNHEIHKGNLAVTLPGNVTMLHKAVEINSPDILEFLLKDEPIASKLIVDVICKSEKGGVAPLHIAALKGFADCAQKIIEGGCNVNVRTTKEQYKSSTALHLAAERGHINVLELILRRDLKSHEIRNDDYWTPLHCAAASGHPKCVRALLWCGADLAASVKDETGIKTATDLIMLCVPQPVDFLEDILDSYVIMEGNSINDDNCKINLKYDILVPDDHCERQLGVINAILNCGKIDTIQKLLLHPLIETFLYLKWKKLSIFFVMIMFLYVVMTVSLTVYAHLMYIEKSSDSTSMICANVASILLITFDIIIFLLEVMNLIQLNRFYLKDFESLVKWGMIVTSFIVGLADPTFAWTKYVAAVAVLLSWVELLFLLSRCPSWGYYVLMFSRVAINVLKVLGTFVLLFIGFTFSFLILFEAREPFRNFFEAFVKMIVMMLEFDYQNMFEPVKDVLALSVTGRIIFVFFVILVSIVMMNLMLGLAVSDISALEAQGKTQRLVKQAQFLSLLEMVVYNKTLKKLLPPAIHRSFEHKRAVDNKVIVRPSKPIESINHSLPKNLRESVIDLIWTKTSNEDVEVTINLQDINQKIEDLTERVVNQSSSSTSDSSSSSTTVNYLQIIMTRLDEIQKEQQRMKTVFESNISNKSTRCDLNYGNNADVLYRT